MYQEELLIIHRLPNLARQKALDYYNRALPLDRGIRDRSGEAETPSYIGMKWT